MVFRPAVVVVLALAAPAGVAAQDDFRWQGVVGRGKTLEVAGINGDVHAAAASGNRVEVVAERRGRRDDPEEVKIAVVEHGDGVTICAIYPSRRRQSVCQPGNQHLHNDDNDVEVTFRVKVPAGVRFVGKTVNGSVDALGLDEDVTVESVNGNVEATTRGVAEGTSVNGSVRLAMGRANWTGALKLASVNGNVTVELPADASFDVTASTLNGDMESDFPVSVRGKFGLRKFSGTIGKGGRSLVVDTVNGNIRLRKAT